MKPTERDMGDAREAMCAAPSITYQQDADEIAVARAIARARAEEREAFREAVRRSTWGGGLHKLIAWLDAREKEAGDANDKRSD